MTLRSFRSIAALVSRKAATPAAARLRLFGAAVLPRFAAAVLPRFAAAVLPRFAAAVLPRFAVEPGGCRGFATGRTRAVVLATEAGRCRSKAPGVLARETTSGVRNVASTSRWATADGSVSFPETPYATTKPLTIRLMPSSEPPSRLNGRL
jgi:hypothetical protein